MVRIIRDSQINDVGKITLAFNFSSESDMAIIRKIEHLIFEEQPRCENCINFYREGYFCGYNACMCKVHGCLEVYPNPHYDMDGSKCEDYKRKDDVNNV